MDDSRFDTFSKGVATGLARRGLLVAALTIAIGAALPGDDRGEVAARKRRRRKKRRSPPPCIPACDGKTCGDDGCDGQCGTCLAADSCQSDACVCATPDAPGPGDICGAPGECCPYTVASERSCDRGAGSCATFLPVCRYGLGGKCASGCDCMGDLECRSGTCRCPGDRDYIDRGRCCGVGLSRCGDVCCLPGRCLCPLGDSCRCI